MTALEYTEHERSERTEERDDESSGPEVVVETETSRARVSIPADATAPETAAIAASIVAALESEKDDRPAEGTVDQWVLSGRLDVDRRRDLPRSCRRGGEWAAAGRLPNA